jgi:transketolase
MPGSESAGACQAMARELRRWIVEQSLAANVGHVGSALSIVDIMAVLWEGTMRGPGTEAEDRDRFILSKGHAALALYAALRWKGILDEAAFRSFCRDGSLLGVHPHHGIPGVDVSTGSLGLGLSVGCGLAHGLGLKGHPSRVYVIVSDAECNEGQIWEAAMFAAHHGLSNLVAVVDLNGLQALGRTAEILSLDMVRLWSAFGWDTVAVDGHHLDGLLAALDHPPRGGRPRAIVASTVLGKGVSFMEGQLEWHYRNLTPELARRALEELEARA